MCPMPTLPVSNLLFMNFEHPMYYGYIPALHFKHNNLPNSDWLFFVVSEKQKIPSVKCWFHTATVTKTTTTYSLLKVLIVRVNKIFRVVMLMGEFQQLDLFDLHLTPLLNLPVRTADTK